MTTKSDEDFGELRTFPVRLRGRGQMTMPRAVREALAVDEGDIVTLVQFGAAYLLTPRSRHVPRLADRFAKLMEEGGVSLAALLEGLEAEREAIQRERRA